MKWNATKNWPQASESNIQQTEETRFKNDRCSQTDQIDNTPRQKSVSQEMVHIVYQLFTKRNLSQWNSTQ
jgi:hypothetical protein